MRSKVLYWVAQATQAYLYGVSLEDSMWWNLCWVRRGHLGHGVDLLMSVAAYVAVWHDVLQGQPDSTARPVSSHQQIVSHLRHSVHACNLLHKCTCQKCFQAVSPACMHACMLICMYYDMQLRCESK